MSTTPPTQQDDSIIAMPSDSDSPSDGSSSDEDCAEDFSGMDDKEFLLMRRHKTEELHRYEEQFYALRDQLCDERLTMTENTLQKVQAGIAQEYLKPLDELANNMRKRIEVARVLRNCRICSIKTKFEAETLATEQDFRNEQQMAKDKIKEEVEEKIRRLDEDRNNADDFAMEYVPTKPTKRKPRGRKRHASKTFDFTSPVKRKPTTVSGPYIVYMLQDEEILEDWTIVKKALQMSSRKDRV